MIFWFFQFLEPRLTCVNKTMQMQRLQRLIICAALALSAGQECDDPSDPSLIQVNRSNSKEGPLALGGFCMAAYANKCLWGERATIILPGSFQPDPWCPINPANWKTSPAAQGHIWLTLGGEGVGVKNPEECFKLDKAVAEAQKVGANGIAFDMEGCYYQGSGGLEQLISAIRKQKSEIPSSIKLMIVGGGDEAIAKYEDLKDVFDFIAPMLYWGSDSYQDHWTVPIIKDVLQKAEDAGWPKDKMYLTFQSESAAASETGKQVLTFLAEEACKKKYLGLFGWPASDETINTKNLDFISSMWKSNQCS